MTDPAGSSSIQTAELTGKEPGPSEPAVGFAAKEHRRTLLFDVRRSVRYHQARRRHYERWNTATDALQLIFGSTAFAALMKIDEVVIAPASAAGGDAGISIGKLVALAAAAIITALAILNLVVGSSAKARLHMDLARRFTDLERKIIRHQSPDMDMVAEWKCERLIIETDEPPIKRVVDCIAYNEVIRAGDYDPDDVAEIGTIQRAFAHFFDFREHTILTKAQKKAAIANQNPRQTT